MKSVYLDFLKKLLVFSIAIAAVSITINYLMPHIYTSPAVPFLVPFFFSLTLIFHYLHLKSIDKSFIRFTSSYMLLTFSKLALLLILLMLYVFLHPKEAIPFIIWYFLFYLLYTFFEAIALKNIDTDKK